MLKKVSNRDEPYMHCLRFFLNTVLTLRFVIFNYYSKLNLNLKVDLRFLRRKFHC